MQSLQKGEAGALHTYCLQDPQAEARAAAMQKLQEISSQSAAAVQEAECALSHTNPALFHEYKVRYNVTYMILNLPANLIPSERQAVRRSWQLVPL
jgi:hypothetical protein